MRRVRDLKDFEKIEVDINYNPQFKLCFFEGLGKAGELVIPERELCRDKITIALWDCMKNSSIVKVMNGRIDLYPLADALIIAFKEGKLYVEA